MPQIRLISLKEVCERTSLSRTYINRLRGTGQFPEPVRLGRKRLAFIETEIDAWISERIAKREAAK